MNLEFTPAAPAPRFHDPAFQAEIATEKLNFKNSLETTAKAGLDAACAKILGPVFSPDAETQSPSRFAAAALVAGGRVAEVGARRMLAA